MRKSLFAFTTALLLLPGLTGPVEAQEVSRLRFPTIAMKDFYFNLSTEYWTEKVPYWLSDYVPRDIDPDSDEFEDFEFEGEGYYEWTTAFTVLYGITNRWQAGVVVPVVVRHLERDDEDGLSALDDSVTQTSLGDIALQLNYQDAFAGGEGTLYASLEGALPTDTADFPFDPGDGSVTAFVFADQYWGAFGLQGNAAYSYYFGWDLSILEYGLGAGYLLTDSLLFTLEPGGEYILAADWDPEERNVFNIEAALEYDFSDRHSLLLSFFAHLDGPSDGRAVTLEFSF